MNRNQKTAMALVLAGLLTSAGVASAQDAGNIGFHGGWSKAQDADEGNFLVGGHAELRLMPWLGVQGAVDYRLADKYELPDGESLKIRNVPITVTARLYPVATEQVSIFAAAGAGWYHYIYDYSEGLEDELGVDDSSTNTFGWHVGAGLEIPVAPAVAIYGEGRAIFVDPDRDVDEDLVDDVEEFDYDSLYFAAGLNFKF